MNTIINYQYTCKSNYIYWILQSRFENRHCCSPFSPVSESRLEADEEKKLVSYILTDTSAPFWFPSKEHQHGGCKEQEYVEFSFAMKRLFITRWVVNIDIITSSITQTIQTEKGLAWTFLVLTFRVETCKAHFPCRNMQSCSWKICCVENLSLVL